MPERSSRFPTTRQVPHKLIMVIEQDSLIGTQFVQQIQQETPFRAILATSLLQVRRLLGHLKCDVFLLTDDTFPEEDLECLYLLPGGVEPPELINLIFLSGVYDHQNETDRKSLIEAVKLLLCVHHASPGMILVGSVHAFVREKGSEIG